MWIPGFIRRVFAVRSRREEDDFKFDLFLHDLFHIDGAQVLLYLEGRCTPEEKAQIEAHLAVCQQCRAEIADLRKLTND